MDTDGKYCGHTRISIDGDVYREAGWRGRVRVAMVLSVPRHKVNPLWLHREMLLGGCRESGKCPSQVGDRGQG